MLLGVVLQTTADNIFVFKFAILGRSIYLMQHILPPLLYISRENKIVRKKLSLCHYRPLELVVYSLSRKQKTTSFSEEPLW